MPLARHAPVVAAAAEQRLAPVQMAAVLAAKEAEVVAVGFQAAAVEAGVRGAWVERGEVRAGGEGRGEEAAGRQSDRRGGEAMSAGTACLAGMAQHTGPDDCFGSAACRRHTGGGGGTGGWQPTPTSNACNGQ